MTDARAAAPLVPRGWALTTRIAAVAAFFVSWWPLRGFVADDTFIHLTYARHFRDGAGLVFNLGERVYGTTSPLWTLALGVLGRTGVDLLLLSRILSVAAGLATVGLGSLALQRLLTRWKERHGLDPLAAGIAWSLGSLALAADVWLARWSASGMESSFGTLLVLGGFTSMLTASTQRRQVVAAACWWSLASLTRPEACLLLAWLALWCLLQPEPLARRIRALVLAAVPPLVLGGAWLAYAASFYGTVIPLTLASKAAEQVPLLQNVALQARELGADRGVELMALALGLPWLLARARLEWRDHMVPAGWLIALPLFYCATGVPGITRYLLLLVPLLVVYGWLALGLAASRLPAAARAAALLVAGLAALGVNGFVSSRHVVPQARAFERILDESLIPMANWFRTYTPESTRVAIPHVGVFGYYSHRRVLDLGGLVTPGISADLARDQYERVVLEFQFAKHARPDYLLDVDTESRRMLRQSPYARCLTLIEERPFDYRSIQHPEPAFLTVYRIDWACADARRAGEEAVRR